MTKLIEVEQRGGFEQEKAPREAGRKIGLGAMDQIFGCFGGVGCGIDDDNSIVDEDVIALDSLAVSVEDVDIERDAIGRGLEALIRAGDCPVARIVVFDIGVFGVKLDIAFGEDQKKAVISKGGAMESPLRVLSEEPFELRLLVRELERQNISVDNHHRQFGNRCGRDDDFEFVAAVD